MTAWLMKSEPETYSIDDLKRDRRTSWEGVRNYQARNFMRGMKKGDRVLFYHSNANPPGVAGIAKVVQTAHPDLAALDKKSPYHDPKATRENPIWEMVDIAFVRTFPRVVGLAELKANPKLKSLMVLQKGSRLSVQPVSEEHFKEIERMV